MKTEKYLDTIVKFILFAFLSFMAIMLVNRIFICVFPFIREYKDILDYVSYLTWILLMIKKLW